MFWYNIYINCEKLRFSQVMLSNKYGFLMLIETGGQLRCRSVAPFKINITIDVPQPYNKAGDGPEGPEVYVMTQRFARRFPVGHSLVQVKSLCERYTTGTDIIPTKFTNALPLAIKKITSRGKKTIIKFGEWGLLISYGMTGHWETSASKYAQLELTFTNPAGFADKYYWVSSRSLPTCVVRFMKKNELGKEIKKLGLDIIRDDPDPEKVLAVYGKSRKNIATFLMEQNYFCGIGNYIRAVILYRCKVSPHLRCHELDDGLKWLLWDTAKEVAHEAIAAKGMGIRDYKDEKGKRVGIAFDITPYSMKKDRLGNEVITEQIGGRTVWWVPEVQA